MWTLNLDDDILVIHDNLWFIIDVMNLHKVFISNKKLLKTVVF